MNSGATSQRVYGELKMRLMAGRYRPGERLEPVQIGELLSSSATPVRDALHILVGEGLVETRTSDGFHAVGIDAPGLEDLYRWNEQVLALVLKTAPPSPELLRDSSPADQAARLFAYWAEASGNTEHARAMKSLNDRLHAARLVEGTVLTGCEAELTNLANDAIRSDPRTLRYAVASYHRRRVRHAAEIVRALYRI